MSANYETSSVSVTMQGVVAFIHRTQPYERGGVVHVLPLESRSQIISPLEVQLERKAF